METDNFANIFLNILLKRAFDDPEILDVEKRLNTFNSERLKEVIEDCYHGVGYDSIRNIIEQYFYIVLTEDYKIIGIDYIDLYSNRELDITFVDDIKDENIRKLKDFNFKYTPFFVDIEELIRRKNS